MCELGILAQLSSKLTIFCLGMNAAFSLKKLGRLVNMVELDHKWVLRGKLDT